MLYLKAKMTKIIPGGGGGGGGGGNIKPHQISKVFVQKCTDCLKMICNKWESFSSC